VERPIFDRFVAAMEAAVNQMVMGDPLDEKTDIGTIVSEGQLEKVRGFIAEGTATPGAVAHVCSAMPTDPALKKGLFIQPVIFTGQQFFDGSACTAIKTTAHACRSLRPPPLRFALYLPPPMWK
jgi:acyl-CoA reductase-like NAD-dependent aldehyde dehydrogenase